MTLYFASYPEKIKIKPETSAKFLFELLKQGRIDDFNKIREREHSSVPNFSEAKLEGAELEMRT